MYHLIEFSVFVTIIITFSKNCFANAGNKTVMKIKKSYYVDPFIFETYKDIQPFSN